MKPVPALVSILALAAVPTAARAADPPEWVEPMKKVHAKFTGTPGTFALFGDSITHSLAFWAPCEYAPKTLPAELARDLDTVRKHTKPECWAKWRGPAHGNQGSMTIRWAHENVDAWLKRLNPEAAVLMFGTNDLNQLGDPEYEQKTREVVEKCLRNGLSQSTVGAGDESRSAFNVHVRFSTGWFDQFH